MLATITTTKTKSRLIRNYDHIAITVQCRHMIRIFEKKNINAMRLFFEEWHFWIMDCGNAKP